jgi:hypothetical protein
VNRFWKRRGDSELEGELRRLRPEAGDEFVASVADRVRGPRKVYRGVRVGVAIALTVGLLAALAPVGAASYAGGAAANLVSAAAHVVVPGKKAGKGSKNTPAKDQYKKPKVKKKKPKRHAKKHKKKNRAGARAHRGPRFTG